VTNHLINRRSLLCGLAASAIGSSVLGTPATAAQGGDWRIAAFEKFIQTLNYDQLGAEMAQRGFTGIEATVRDRGHISPEKAEQELPKMVEALRKHGVEITVMASSINSVKQPLTERVLKTAAMLGVKRYRMAYYRYDKKTSPQKQLEQLRPVVKDLVQMGRELGITAVYQNHAGAGIVGAPIWDLLQLFRGYSPKEIGIAYDIRHATVEGGLAWPLHFRAALPHLAAVYVKDFVWKQRKPENVPLGKGRVDPAFFAMLKKLPQKPPISLHVEYLPKASTQENLAALSRDIKSLRALLQ